jgi:hypothetical protein
MMKRLEQAGAVRHDMVKAVRAIQPPEISVNVPETVVNVKVPEQKSLPPVVNMKAPVVNISAPKPPSYELSVERDANGLIDKIIARPI